MPYASWSVVFGEQPSATKWNILGTNDAYFSGILDATGMPLQIVNTVSTAVATGTTVIPRDDTIPQITEGTEFITRAITPKATTNILVIDCTAFVSVSADGVSIIGALFQDATAGALAAATSHMGTGTATGVTMMRLTHTMAAGTVSSTTFRLRIGPNTASTVTFNGASATRQFGAINKSSIIITEYKT